MMSKRSMRASAESGTVQIVAVNDCLDVAFELLGELLALAGKDFDAVVLKRIVRGRDDDPGVERHHASHVGNGRSRNDACRRDRCTGGTGSASKLTFDPFARLARIPADQEAKRTIVVPHGLDEGSAQPRNGLGIEWRFAGLAANAVGPEKSLGHQIRDWLERPRGPWFVARGQ